MPLKYLLHEDTSQFADICERCNDFKNAYTGDNNATNLNLDDSIFTINFLEIRLRTYLIF